MRHTLIAALLLAATLFAAQQPATQKSAGPAGAGVVYLPAKQLEQSKPGTPVIDRDRYGLMYLKRDSAGEAELHQKDTDIFYIVDGRATFVTGGKIEGGKATAPGETRGKAIIGGQTHQLAKGDSIVIPRQTPHWFKAVDGTMTYFVVKIHE